MRDQGAASGGGGRGAESGCGSGGGVQVWNAVDTHSRKSYSSIIHGKWAHEETIATASFAGVYLARLTSLQSSRRHRIAKFLQGQTCGPHAAQWPVPHAATLASCLI